VRSREIARRYAEALYRLSYEEGCVDQIEGDYRRVLSEITEVPDFSRFLTHPLVSRERKNGLVEQSFPQILGYLRNLFTLLIRNGREDYLELIYEEFLTLRAEEEGIIRVKVATAQELSLEDRDGLVNRLAKALGGRVELEERLDPDLLGGVRIEVDGKVVDATLRAKLRGLRTLIEG